MRHAIFDMDGTLINSEPVWHHTTRSVVMEIHGIDLSTEFIARCAGNTTLELSHKIARQYPEKAINPHELFEAIVESMSTRIGSIALLPGAKEILLFLRDNGIGLAIASSSPLSFIQKVVDLHNLPVTVLTSGYEVNRSKPHPEIFELTATRLDAKPWQCRVWEDSVNGMIGALSAQMEVIVIPENPMNAAHSFSLAHHTHHSLLESLEHLKRELYQSCSGKRPLPR